MRFSPPVVAPRPHPRVVHSTVDDTHVLFHLDDRRLHVLNPSAAAIWSELGDATTVGDLAIRVADRFGADPGSIRTDVDQLLDRLRADGLLTVDDRPPAARVAPPTPAPLAQGTRRPVVGSYLALDAALALVCDDDELARLLDEILHPLRSERPPIAEIRISRAGDRYEIAVGDGEPTVAASRLAVVLRALAEVNAAAVGSASNDLVLHAGAVAGEDGAVLMPAASNHGKSTLTAALVSDGLRYLTDEAAAVADGLVVRPFTKSIVLDPGSFSLFPDLEPCPRDGVARALAGREWHIDPRRVGTVAGPTPVRVIVCPHWRAGAVTRVHRYPPTEAMHVLLAESFDFSHGGQVVFDRLAELVETIPVYRLGYSDLREAVTEVGALLRDPG